MSPNDQRIAIAKAVGWKLGTYYTHWNHAPCGVRSYSCERDMLEGVPRYTESLDAMHEAEKVLDEQQAMEYVTELMVICMGADSDRGHAFATAAQRAEAFLRILNLWTES